MRWLHFVYFPGWNATPSQVCQDADNSLVPILLLSGERHHKKCLAQEHNTMTQANAKTRTAQSGAQTLTMPLVHHVSLNGTYPIFLFDKFQQIQSTCKMTGLKFSLVFDKVRWTNIIHFLASCYILTLVIIEVHTVVHCILKPVHLFFVINFTDQRFQVINY